MIGTVAVAAAFWALGVVMTTWRWLRDRDALVRRMSAHAHSSYWRGYAAGARFVAGAARRVARAAGPGSGAQAAMLRAFGAVAEAYAFDADVESIAVAAPESLRDMAAARGVSLDAITPKLPTNESPPGS